MEIKKLVNFSALLAMGGTLSPATLSTSTAEPWIYGDDDAG